MRTERKIIVDEEDKAKRIDVYLSPELGISRNQIQQLISNQHILVNNKLVQANYKLRTQDIITITLPEPRKLEAEPEDIPIHIIYEDKDIVVINKPAGMVVHPPP